MSHRGHLKMAKGGSVFIPERGTIATGFFGGRKRVLEMFANKIVPPHILTNIGKRCVSSWPFQLRNSEMVKAEDTCRSSHI